MVIVLIVKLKFEATSKGTFENWERQKVLNNKLSWIDDMILSVENWKEEEKSETL